MNILKQVEAAYNFLSLSEKEARNMALACALEPLSDKPGCVTRYEDNAKNTLEMFIAGAVNIYPAYYHLAEYLQEKKSPVGMYKFFKEAVFLSKANRDGGQINLGILEFSFPIVAAHILYDPSSKGGVVTPDLRYERMGGGAGWVMVREIGAQARTKLFADGIKAFVAVRENGDGTYTYSIGRMSPYIPLPVDELPDFFNTIEGIGADAKDRWGGGNTIIGSPRKSGSKQTPKELETNLNDYLRNR